MNGTGAIEFEEFEKLYNFLRRDGVLAPLPVEGLSGQRAVAVACGEQHTAVVTEDGGLWTFGRGGGRLGHANTANKYVPTAVQMPAASGGLAGPVRVRSVACGEHHTAAVTEGMLLCTFGRGSEGQLGHGDGVTKVTPTLVRAQPVQRRAAAASF